MFRGQIPELRETVSLLKELAPDPAAAIFVDEINTTVPAQKCLTKERGLGLCPGRGL
jgi:hypothetical protein